MVSIQAFLLASQANEVNSLAKALYLPGSDD